MPLKVHLEDQPTLNLTSLIDVLFLLIIFFMVGTRFVQTERKLNLQVPVVSDKGTLSAAPEKRIVNVYRTGQVALDGQMVSLVELTARLSAARSQYQDLGVLVRGDADGTFQTVAGVLNACRQAGVTRLAVAVRSTSER
ncbi:MAG: biopolymer transporter ExbD [Planctomycetia bacterium]|nr:biopolymer transporter ExbD [Planctomycetia bacterium]